jgi:hypothetical protein
VRVRKGLGTTNLQIRDDCKNIDDHSCCMSCRPLHIAWNRTSSPLI